MKTQYIIKQLEYWHAVSPYVADAIKRLKSQQNQIRRLRKQLKEVKAEMNKLFI